MEYKTYLEAEKMQKDLNSLNELSLLLHYHCPSKLTITNDTGMSKTFESKTLFDRLDKFIVQEIVSIKKNLANCRLWLSIKHLKR